MVLSPAELKSLTGYVQPAKQIAWLRREAFPFKVRADGTVAILHSAVESVMGGGKTPPKKTKRAEPDFGILRSS